MSANAVTPPGWHTVTPRIVAEGAERCVAFVKDVFGAAGDYQATRPTELQLGDSMLMIGEGADTGGGVMRVRPMALHVFVKDVDATFNRAVAAGATSMGEPTDRHYGERSGFVDRKSVV